MTILVTGATGPVGTRLLPRLVEAGVDCRALVRHGKSAPDGVTPVEGDILDPDSLDGAPNGVTDVVHMAALFRTQDTDAIHRTNVEGTRNLIAATKAQAPQARPIMASTNLVYGSGLTRPAREDDPTAADSPYPASKILAETDLKASSLNWSILRFGFFYGDKDGHLESAPALMANWKWHPAQTLDLVHHRDIAAAVELALTGALDGHTVNVVDQPPTSIYEIAQIVGAPYEPSAEPLDDPWKGRADDALLRTLGFTATVPTVYHAQRDGRL
ncbi:NAD-dependent epimerase/dehydratase family protein [Streptomyces globisporus]|uniref:NAD-dependent epimerase/dehydratase family protein n=1 Tax=Streptomyces globisporus TaxID=1908 RepID=UPI00369EF1BE